MKNGSSRFVCCHFFCCYVLVQVLEFIVVVIVFIDGYDISSVLRPAVADFHQVEWERQNGFHIWYDIFFLRHYVILEFSFLPYKHLFAIDDIYTAGQFVNCHIQFATCKVVDAFYLRRMKGYDGSDINIGSCVTVVNDAVD